MKKIGNIICFFLILFVNCGNADEPRAGTQNNSNPGTADITIDGESIEITSVFCEAEEYNYRVEASGSDHSLEILFGKDYSNNPDGELDFSRANHIEMYIFGSESTATYRGKTGSEPGFDISGSETHATGTAELARYNDDDDVITVKVDIRCET